MENFSYPEDLKLMEKKMSIATATNTKFEKMEIIETSFALLEKLIETEPFN